MLPLGADALLVRGIVNRGMPLPTLWPAHISARAVPP